MDDITKKTSENLQGMEDFLGAKHDEEPNKDEPVTKLDPVPGADTTVPDTTEPDSKLADGGPEPAVKLVEEEPAVKPDENEEEIVTPDIPDSVLSDEYRTEEPKKEESTVPEVSDDELSKWPEKQAEAFKSMRLELKTLKEASKTSTPSQPSEEQSKALEEANKQLDEAHNAIARLNLAEDPRFKAKYDSQIGFLVGQIKSQAKALELDESIVPTLANMGLKQRMAFINNNAPSLKDVAMPLFTQIDMLRNARSAELKDAKAQTQQMSELQAKELNMVKSQALTETVTKAAGKGHFLLKTAEGNEKWNAQVQQNIKTAEDILASDDPVRQTEAIVLGALANDYLKLYLQERTARQTALKQLSKYQKAGGNIRNPGGGDDTPSTKTPKVLTPDQMLNELEKKKARRSA